MNVVFRVRAGFVPVAGSSIEMSDFLIFTASFQSPGAILGRDFPSLVGFVFAFPFPFLFGNVGAARFAPVAKSNFKKSGSVEKLDEVQRSQILKRAEALKN